MEKEWLAKPDKTAIYTDVTGEDERWDASVTNPMYIRNEDQVRFSELIFKQFT